MLRCGDGMAWRPLTHRVVGWVDRCGLEIRDHETLWETRMEFQKRREGWNKKAAMVIVAVWRIPAV